MYQASRNIVQLSNKRIVEYEKEAAATNKQIKEQTVKLEATLKELHMLKDGKDQASMKVMV